MYKKVLVVAAMIVMLAGFAVGCGGGNQESNQDQGSNPKTGQAEQEKTGQGETGKAQRAKKPRTTNAREVKASEGVVRRVDTERNFVIVKPPEERVLVFRYNPDKVKVMLDGNEAGVRDIEKGQQATVSYVVARPPKAKNDRNVARIISVEPGGSQGGGEAGGGTTG